MSTSFLQRLQASVPAMPETMLSELALKNYAYCRNDEGISFERMKARLGREFAIAFERQYHGIEQLERQKRIALVELNQVLEAMGKCCMVGFPQGDPSGLHITPADIAFGLPVFSQGDYWYVVTKTPREAIDVVNAVPGCDVINIETEKALTANEAACVLESGEYSPTFGVALQETLCEFLNNWSRGLFPEFEIRS